MVGIPRTHHHRRFIYEKDRHHPSRSRRWRSRRRRSACRHRRRRGGAQLHDDHHAVHQQYGDGAIDDHRTVDDEAITDTTGGILGPPLPEHGQQVRVQLWFGLGLPGWSARGSNGSIASDLGQDTADRASRAAMTVREAYRLGLPCF